MHCLVLLNQVDGIEALERLIEVLDTKILDQSHIFTGVHFKFTNRFDDFFQVGRGPTKRPEQLPSVDPWESFNQSLIDESSYADNEEYEYENNDHNYESFDAWMYRQREEALEQRLELEKVNRPLKRIFNKIPVMRHVTLTVDYETKRGFDGEKFKRYMLILPLEQIEYFRTNLRISEFIHDLKPGQMANLKTIYIDELMNAVSHTMNKLFAVCPNLQNWLSPIPANMIQCFGVKKHLIKNLKLTSFVTPSAFRKIHEESLVLTELVANSTKCAIGKWSYPDIVRLIRDNRETLEVLQMTEPFLKFVVDSDLPQTTNVRKIVIGKCTKATKTSALVKFPNAII